MIVTIPKNITPVQPNIGDSFGDIQNSFNLDLTSNRGKIRVSPRTNKITSSATVATLVSPSTIVKSDARSSGNYEWWVLCNQRLLISNGNADPTTSYIVDPTGSSPTTALSSLYSDMVEFDGKLFVSLLTDIARLSAGSWTADYWTGAGTLNQSALTTGIPHPLTVSFNNLFCIGGVGTTGNKMATVTSGGTLDAAAVTLPTDYQIQWIKSSNSSVWIGAHSLTGRVAKIFRWDGVSENYVDDYKVNSNEVFSCVIKDEIPYIVNGNGQLMAFNGNGFTEVARFPIADNRYRQLSTGGNPIHKHGMSLINGSIHILLAYSLGSVDYTDNMASGIWEYTQETGLYHKYGVTNGLANAFDFGTSRMFSPGALVATSKLYGEFVACSNVIQDSGSTTAGIIFNLDIVQDSTLKTGYLITPKILSSNIEDMWQKIFLNYTKLLNTSDQIIVKYLTTTKKYTNANEKVCTWATSTTFTSADTQTWTDVSVGDEIEILTGQGAGLTANITAISLVSTTYTITIDYTLTSVSADTFLCKVRNWTKLHTIQDLVSENYPVGVGTNSNWIQFKIVMFAKGLSPELQKLSIVSKPHLQPI